MYRLRAYVNEHDVDSIVTEEEIEQHKAAILAEKGEMVCCVFVLRCVSLVLRATCAHGGEHKPGYVMKPEMCCVCKPLYARDLVLHFAATQSCGECCV